MKIQKYSVNQHLIETVLTWVKSGEIAIPEIQRPFIWDASKVRDLMDSLYHGYPIGYLIAWRNPNVKLKDGSSAEGRKILIDGQQRVAAFTAAILGEPLINKEYRKVRIRIAFHPIKEKFEVLNPAIEKDANWIADISEIIAGNINLLGLVKDYCSRNKGVDENLLFKRVDSLSKIRGKQLGFIELDSDLDLETVTTIFIRINSKGVPLSQADFAMSKIAANEKYNGSTMRKGIDYFCHLAIAPEFYANIVDIDKDFISTDYFRKMSWLKHEKEDLYNPKYSDLLRVAFTSEFNRGKLADLVGLLSGRNFETRTYEEEIAEQSFATLKKGILNFINENNFKRLLMIIKSAGFISPNLIRSQNALNFAYILFLKLRSKKYHPADIESYVRKWFVFSILTGRYSASPETQFDFDIKNVSKNDFNSYLTSMESAELSEAFWDVSLIQRLNTSVSNSPYFNVYLATQVKANNKGFLSKDITVNDLISHKGDIHHIFPTGYLKKHGMTQRQYNQIANYVYMQSETNIQIGDKAPSVYFNEVHEQTKERKLKYGGIDDFRTLQKNLRQNCIPETVFSMEIDSYEEFLMQRRKLMAQKIKKYYYHL